MTERHRITRIKSTTTKSGKPVVEMYDRDTRLEFPVLRLFTFDDLRTVGIEPANLKPEMVEHVNFWAYYELSEKKTSRGNAYKDVLHLEAIDQPATSTSTDTSAMLQELRSISGELRAIKALLLNGEATPTKAQADAKSRRVQALAHVGSEGDPQTTEAYEVRDFPPEPEPETPAPPIQEASPEPQKCPACGLTECDNPRRCAHTLFHQIAGPAIATGQIKPQTVNKIAKSANGEGWEGALARLREALEGSKGSA